MVSRASSSTAVLSAGVSAPPKNVRPRPTAPWSVPSSSVTNSRVSVGAGRPTTSGLSAGVRSTRVVTCVIFMGLSPWGCGRLQYTSVNAQSIKGLVQADRVHRAVYTDPALFELELDRIFGRAWLILGHESQVRRPGGFFTTRLAREPPLLPRPPHRSLR